MDEIPELISLQEMLVRLNAATEVEEIKKQLLLAYQAVAQQYPDGQVPRDVAEKFHATLQQSINQLEELNTALDPKALPEWLMPQN